MLYNNTLIFRVLFTQVYTFVFKQDAESEFRIFPAEKSPDESSAQSEELNSKERMLMAIILDRFFLILFLASSSIITIVLLTQTYSYNEEEE